MDEEEHIYDLPAENGISSVDDVDLNSEENHYQTEDQDYLHHYEETPPQLPPPPEEHKYDFDQESVTSEASAKDGNQSDQSSTRSLGSMADQIVDGVKHLKTDDSKSVDKSNKVVNGDADANGKKEAYITLFVKAGSDKECIGCCPFSQRLFMMLWLKGVVFNVTTVDKTSKPKVMEELASGSSPPFLLFNQEVLTDVQKCEQYIDEELSPPRYPILACKHNQSKTIGQDIFLKFSRFVKFNGNKNDPKFKQHENALNKSLKVLNDYLNEPLDDEIDEGDDSDEAQVSQRPFIDGDKMTIADCNMLPKLNMIRVTGEHMLNYHIPEEFKGIHRYLKAADEVSLFKDTCPADREIVWTYGGRMKKGHK